MKRAHIITGSILIHKDPGIFGFYPTAMRLSPYYWYEAENLQPNLCVWPYTLEMIVPEAISGLSYLRRNSIVFRWDSLLLERVL